MQPPPGPSAWVRGPSPETGGAPTSYGYLQQPKLLQPTAGRVPYLGLRPPLHTPTRVVYTYSLLYLYSKSPVTLKRRETSLRQDQAPWTCPPRNLGHVDLLGCLRQPRLPSATAGSIPYLGLRLPPVPLLGVGFYEQCVMWTMGNHDALPHYGDAT